jgi:hypothetical protein
MDDLDKDTSGADNTGDTGDNNNSDSNNNGSVDVNLLKQKAEFFDMLDSDEEVAAAIKNIFEARRNGGNRKTTSDDTTSDDKNKGGNQTSNKLDPEVATRLEAAEREVSRLRALQKISDVKTRYQDFDDYRSDIAEILKKYPNIDIEDAYKYAAALKPKTKEDPEDDEYVREKSRAALSKNKINSVAGVFDLLRRNPQAFN